jgi:hypothetical protein
MIALEGRVVVNINSMDKPKDRVIGKCIAPNCGKPVYSGGFVVQTKTGPIHGECVIARMGRIGKK